MMITARSSERVSRPGLGFSVCVSFFYVIDAGSTGSRIVPRFRGQRERERESFIRDYGPEEPESSRERAVKRTYEIATSCVLFLECVHILGTRGATLTSGASYFG
jgi:hypothetical protein